MITYNLDPLCSLLSFRVNPFARIARIVFVSTLACNSGNLRNPVLAQQIVGIAVLRGELAHFRVIERGEPAVADDRVLLAGLGRDDESREQEVNMQMAVENAVFTGPFLF